MESPNLLIENSFGSLNHLKRGGQLGSYNLIFLLPLGHQNKDFLTGFATWKLTVPFLRFSPWFSRMGRIILHAVGFAVLFFLVLEDGAFAKKRAREVRWHLLRNGTNCDVKAQLGGYMSTVRMKKSILHIVISILKIPLCGLRQFLILDIHNF